ncbi:unnamed protein product [Bursaphelenchus okinawaensis]|uniref:Uncharacterized protein n=1 Tax=Bursaphelenchus okinawaensis TaxID=465554 RepID=A0A811LNZ6_9BILA|nr:unnamed protein product [Bursaphelenchus okinawaensis]CAG9124713.1 unnamed protein product [Bursaphelenchus okinawaensis]
MSRSLNNEAKERIRQSELMVNIGNVEVESVLPTASEYTKGLYDQIRDKEQRLAKMKESLEHYTEQNEKEQKEVDNLTAERDNLKGIAENEAKQIEDDQHNVKVGRKETSRLHKEIEAVRHRLNQTIARREEMTSHLQKQQLVYQDLQEKLHQRTMQKRTVDTKLNVAETNAQELQGEVSRDQKTIRELETYLARVTRQIYERQRQIDDLKLGQLDRKAEIEGIRKMIKNIEGKQKEIQDKYMKNMAVRDRLKMNVVNAQNHATNVDIEVEKLKRRQAEEEQFIASNNLKIKDLEEEGRRWEKEWLVQNNKYTEINLQLAEVNSENNVLRNRIERYKALTQALLSEDSIAMYKAYIIGAPELDIDPDDLTTDALDKLIQNRDEKLKEVTEKLEKVKAEVQRKREILENNEAYLGDEAERSSESIGLRSSKSVPDLSKDTKAPKTQLARFDKRRQEILKEEEKRALSDMAQRKKKLEDECSLLTTQCNRMLQRQEEINKDIEIQKQFNEETRQKIQDLKKLTEQEEKEEVNRMEKMRKDKEEKTQQLCNRLADLEANLVLKEQEVNDLNNKMRQAKVDEDNLRNRYSVAKGLRITRRLQAKQVNNVAQSLEEWQSRVEQSERELAELENMLQVSKQQNQLPKLQLATMKPYDEETIELEELQKQEKQLEQELEQYKRHRRAVDAEMSGDITIVEDNNITV